MLNKDNRGYNNSLYFFYTTIQQITYIYINIVISIRLDICNYTIADLVTHNP